MIILAVTVCLLADPPDVSCRTEVFRTDHTIAECRAMLKPVGEWIKAASVGLPVVYIAAACRKGDVL